MILITGATGFIGRTLVPQLMANGYHVRCLLPEQRLKNIPWGVVPEIVTGSLSNDEELFSAVTGVHTIIHLESAQWWGRERDLEQVDLVGTRNLLDAARSARVGRVLMLSHLGSTPASAYPLMRMKGATEEVIRSSGLAYTIIRSGLVFGEDDAFFNHIAMLLTTNPFFFLMPGRGEVVLHPIYIDDIVKVLIQSLEHMDTLDKTIEVGGPEYITLHDMIRTMMRISRRPRVIIPVSPYFLRWINSIFQLFLPRPLITPQWLDLLATNRTAELGTTSRYFDLKLHRLEDTMLTYLPGKKGLFSAIRYMLRRRPRSFM